MCSVKHSPSADANLARTCLFCSTFLALYGYNLACIFFNLKKKKKRGKVRKQRVGGRVKKKKKEIFKSTVISGKAEDPGKVFVYYQVFPQDQIQRREVWY